MSRRSLLASLALLFLFAVPALSPLFTAVPTQSADGLLHLYRLVELNTLWHSGIFWTRWLPDLAYGYGMPLFNYYAPLVYYLTTPLASFGIPFTLALNISFAAAMYLGAVGMFLLTLALLQFSALLHPERSIAESKEGEGQGVRGTQVALIAALAYLYTPYVLFNALERGNLAEQWALAFAPFVLWRVLALCREPNALNRVYAVVSLAAVLLSHNVTAFLFAPLLIGFGLTSVLALPSPLVDWKKSLRALVIVFILAFTLSAFFWMPALLERGAVQIARVIVTPDFDYRFNFVPLTELISFLPRADTGRLNPTFPSTLGVVQIILAIAGIVALARARIGRRALPFFYLAAASCVFILMMLAISQPLWDRVTLLSFVQLPMRLRGLVALGLTPLVGAALFVVPTRWQTLGAGLVSIVLVLSALPMLYPRYAENIPLNPTLSDMISFEQRTGALGTTSFGEYLPAWVKDIPNSTLFEKEYQSGGVPNRFVIPQGVTDCGATLERITQSACVSSDVGWRAIFRAFYFPGWQVLIDQMPIQARPTEPDGLITFDVPSGQHILTVEYAGTPDETFADWLSLLSAVVVVLLAGIGIYRARTVSLHAPLSTLHAPPSMLHVAVFPLLFVALVLIAFKFLYTDRVSNPFVAHFDGTQVEGISQPRDVRFGDEMELLGFDMHGNQKNRGDTVSVTLYWRALPALKTDLSAFVHLTAADGFVEAQKDNLHPANLPTTRWDLNAYAADTHTFEIPTTLAAGEYELRAGLYDPQTNVRLTTPDGADYVLLGKIVVR